MPRIIRIAAAQMGSTHLTDPREKTLSRMLKLLDDAASQGAQLVVFPETAFTTFFPRYFFADQEELESWFEHGDIRTAANTKALFDKAQQLAVDICVGFAEATDDGEHYNTCVYYHAKTGSIISKYRKIHLPGDFEPWPDPNAINQLEKRYFKPGNLGWQAFRVPDLTTSPPERGDPIFGMMICNDRRWAESWRVLGLQGVEVVLCGYNTAGWAPELWGSSADESPEEAERTAIFQHKLSMQAHSYTNATFSVSAARCGLDDGKYDLIAGSCITDPEGRIIAESKTKDDEVIIADCDLDQCRPGKTRTFDFARHRRIEHYGRITSQTGVIEPPKLNERDGSASPNTGEYVIVGSGSPSTKESKKIRILLCNPNATKFMTDNCVKMLQPTLPPDVEVHGFTAPTPAPTAIEGHMDSVMSTAAAVRAIIPMADKYDAFLVACYSDHSLIRPLREELDKPVIGIMEASLFAARTLGNRFGMIATSNRSKPMAEDAIRHYGFGDFCVGVGSCGLGVLELESKHQKEVLDIMCSVAKDLVAKGADTLTLGCAGMTMLKPAVEEAVGEDVQVIDGVLAGVHHLVGLVRMGSKTAKAGMYASSKSDRQRRGQQYF
ncbi:hypothetical protein DTO166G4_8718 [Paecilomyces variotii]|nr:hypothetical protein DTO166G4_8718 [Paecilomyces variotii]KAJ9228533.1 hypothetical protein DTO166G5_8506 [Paecilomyces variotii]